MAFTLGLVMFGGGDLGERYDLLRVLGRGPHAEVHIARNRRTRRPAAVKVLDRAHVRYLRTSGRLRAASELAATRPSGVVACEAIACDAHDRAYVASELLEGQSLAARLARGPVPCADAIVFCLQVGITLCEARDRGVLHGGLKPSNVFVVPDPELPRRERALLADFSIATPIDPTRARAPSGDVRDLGCLLHQLLTGEPYAGEPIAQLIERGIGAALAVAIARTWHEVSIESCVGLLAHAAATSAIDADPTDSKLPLRAPPRTAAPPVVTPTAERTVMFTRVDPDELDRAAG